MEVHAFERFADGATMVMESGPARILEAARDGVVRTCDRVGAVVVEYDVPLFGREP